MVISHFENSPLRSRSQSRCGRRALLSLSGRSLARWGVNAVGTAIQNTPLFPSLTIFMDLTPFVNELLKSAHLTSHHFAHGAYKVRLYNLFCRPRRVEIQQAGRQAGRAGRAARVSSRIVMRRGPTRDKKRPFGVAGIVGIEHQRWR